MMKRLFPKTGARTALPRWRVRPVAALARIAACTGLAFGLGAAPVLAGPAVAGAVQLPADHHGGGGPGEGWAGIGGPSGGWLDHHHDHRGQRLVAGVVSNPSASGFTLTTRQGVALTVSTSDATYVEPGMPTAAATGVVAGDVVWVLGTEPQSGTVDASVVYLPLARYTGTIGQVGSGTFQLTVNVPSLTGTSSTMGGDSARAFAVKAGYEGHHGRGGPGEGWGNGGTANLTGTSTTITVNFASDVVHEPGVTNPAPATGDRARVLGTQDGTGTVTALAVFILPPGDHGDGGSSGASGNGNGNGSGNGHGDGHGSGHHGRGHHGSGYGHTGRGD
jgi:hypothetical protein